MAEVTSFFNTSQGFELLLTGILLLAIFFIATSPRFKKTRFLDIIAFTTMYSYVASGFYHLRYGQPQGYTAPLTFTDKASVYGGAWYSILLLVIFMIVYAIKFPQVMDLNREKRDVHIYTLGVIIMSVLMWAMVLYEIIPITPSFPMDFRETFVTWAQIIGGSSILLYHFVLEVK
ncbi:hypothetical protein LCGC14_0194440 [marine sediment metagenome]|uniref:Uncharacterized protein n=1 Tax=marine sediment metagenome TaxID=412755 RepID=A0A0F9V1L6_9ZZZZ|nr:hypothetical protein [bacterium]